MAKVKKETMEAAMLCLVDKITSTMPNSTYKFLLGGAAGLFSIGGIDKLKSLLHVVEGEDGLVETQNVRKIYDSAFKASGGKMQIELFNKPDSLISILVKPLTLTISKEDIDAIMDDVEKNSVVSEVSLDKQNAK